MPRFVCNFWIDLDTDPSQNHIATGPRTKDGGFSMTIQQRSLGTICAHQVSVTGCVATREERGEAIEVTQLSVYLPKGTILDQGADGTCVATIRQPRNKVPPPRRIDTKKRSCRGTVDFGDVKP